MLARLRGRLALARQDTKSALKYFRVAYADDPDNRETVFGLLLALEMSGDDKAAAPIRETARNLERLNTLTNRAAAPRARFNAGLLRQLGEACASLHRDAEARAWYKLAVAGDPLDSESQRPCTGCATSLGIAARRLVPRRNLDRPHRYRASASSAGAPTGYFATG